MSRADASPLLPRLRKGEIIRLTEAEWQALAPQFTVERTHATGLAGPLLVVRHQQQWAAVERPRPGERVVRPLKGASAADTFVQQRLAAYERMWDG